MPWETRNGKGRYFTVTISKNGKPKRFYFGTAGSPPAELAAVIVEKRYLEFELRVRSQRAYDRKYFAATEEAAVKEMCEALRNPRQLPPRDTDTEANLRSPATSEVVDAQLTDTPTTA